MNDPLRYLWREEITDWGNDTPNHTYITKGTDLIGFVPKGGVMKIFKTPKKTWSPSRRKFRKLGAKEIRSIYENAISI
jgi:hypothetical protein